MRRYRFRLEPVLRVRRQEQDAARGAVLAATALTGAEAEALAERDRAYAAGTGRSRARARAADFVHVQQHRAALGRAVLDQRRRLQRGARRGLAQARTGWTAAAARVGALERLDERQRAEHTARAAKEEEMVVDDLVVSRFGAAR